MITVNRILECTKVVPDFPIPGIPFRDVTPIFANPSVFADVVDWMAGQAEKQGATAIGGIESRGFLFASAVAHQLCLPLVLFRKPGKLPGTVYTWEYTKEYGKDILEAHVDSIHPDYKLAIIDDVLATGGTAVAAGEITKMAGAVPSFIFLFELAAIDGRTPLQPHEVSALTKI
jgi:adenine phosphoribosyltransferase